jgi:hypothetical protein
MFCFYLWANAAVGSGRDAGLCAYARAAASAVSPRAVLEGGADQARNSGGVMQDGCRATRRYT